MEVTTTTSPLLHLEKSTIIIKSSNQHIEKEKEEDISPLHIENIATTTTTENAPETSEEKEKEETELHSPNQLPSSPLLTLPRELRHIILTHISSTSPPPLSSSRLPLPSLLAVNRQLRSEFAQIYYSSHLILAGGSPSPRYEKKFFEGFDPKHKGFIKRVHWLYDSYGTEEQARGRAGSLDRLTGTGEGVWTVGFIDPFDGDGDRRGMVRYVDAFGRERRKGEV